MGVRDLPAPTLLVRHPARPLVRDRRLACLALGDQALTRRRLPGLRAVGFQHGNRRGNRPAP